MMAERDFKTGAMRIGDLIGMSQPDSGIFLPGPSRWYALRVAPQREMQAEIWLKKRGVYAFHPVLPMRQRQFGKMKEYHRRYIPGYIFARFKGDPVAHLVCASPFILGAVTRHSGAWGILEPGRLRPLHAMRPISKPGCVYSGAERAPQSKRVDETGRMADLMHQRRRYKFRSGESALFSGGVFSGQSCEVIELDADGGAKVRMALFGGEVLVSARIEDLTALPKTC